MVVMRMIEILLKNLVRGGNPCLFYVYCQNVSLTTLVCILLYPSFCWFTGSIVGRIYNSSTYVDGDVVWTSPITQGTVKENQEVSTESGSRYYLSSAPLEDTSKQADIAKVKEASVPPAAPQKTATMRASPENLAAALREISGKVTELESSLATMATQEAPAAAAAPASSKSKIDVVLGAQWGDEGKGKLVDMLSQVRNSCFLIFRVFFKSYCKLIFMAKWQIGFSECILPSVFRRNVLTQQSYRFFFLGANRNFPISMEHSSFE